MNAKRIFLQLRKGLPVFKPEWKIRSHDSDAVKEILRDKRTHVLATIMAAYPTTPTKQLAAEFNISPRLINSLAKIYDIHKTDECRREILRQNALKEKNRFGGHHRGGGNKKPVEKIDLDGNVVATYACIKEAAQQNNTAISNISDRCRKITSKPINGYLYRYKII